MAVVVLGSLDAYTQQVFIHDRHQTGPESLTPNL